MHNTSHNDIFTFLLPVHVEHVEYLIFKNKNITLLDKTTFLSVTNAMKYWLYVQFPNTFKLEKVILNWYSRQDSFYLHQ